MRRYPVIPVRLVNRLPIRIAAAAALLLAVGEGPAFAQAGDISTVAGGGPTLPVAATQISLGCPQGVQADPSGAGNLLIADPCFNRIFRFAAGTGQLSVVAGTSAGGFAGDGGAATSAQLNGSLGLDVAVNAAGDVFIADGANNVIRRVDHTSGVITTYAGTGVKGSSGDTGPATSAELNGPRSVAIDALGNVYIADRGNNAIRKVDTTSTPLITTYAGTGACSYTGDGGPATSATLCVPYDVKVDGAGNVFVADYGNNVIRRIDTGSTPTITTYAGTGAFGYGGDGGPATSATFRGAIGLRVDALGDVFVADNENNVIRKVDTSATPMISTYAGDGTISFGGDGGLATSANLSLPAGVGFDSLGNLYVADTSNFRIREVNASTQIISTVVGDGLASNGDGGPATSASLNSAGPAIDGSGNLFLGDFFWSDIRRVDAMTGEITTVAGNGVPTYAGDGGPAASASLNFATGVKADAAGNLFIADFGNCRIRRVDHSTGEITTFAGTGVCGFSGDGGQAALAQLQFPQGLGFDSSGNLFIADRTNRRVRRVDHLTGIITTVAGNGIRGFAGDGGPATSAALFTPKDVVLDASGNLFILDQGNSRIRRVDGKTKIITTYAGNGTVGYCGDNGLATSACLNLPLTVGFDNLGNLYITDTANARVRRVDHTTGIITTVAGNGVAGFSGDGAPATGANISSPAASAVDASGNLYFGDTQNSRIRKVALIGGAVAASINDVTVTQGSTGTTATFTVSVAPTAQAVPRTVDFATQDGTAVHGVDYTAVSGHLSFPTGVLTRSINVPILANAAAGPTLTFSVVLSNCQWCTLTKSDGTGTIQEHRRRTRPRGFGTLARATRQPDR